MIYHQNGTRYSNSAATQPHMTWGTSHGGSGGQTGPTEGGRAVPNRNCGGNAPTRVSTFNRAVGRFTRGSFYTQLAGMIAYLKQEFPGFRAPSPMKNYPGKTNQPT